MSIRQVFEMRQLFQQFNFKLSNAKSDQKASLKKEIDKMRSDLQKEIENVCNEFGIPPTQVLSTVKILALFTLPCF